MNSKKCSENEFSIKPSLYFLYEMEPEELTKYLHDEFERFIIKERTVQSMTVFLDRIISLARGTKESLQTKKAPLINFLALEGMAIHLREIHGELRITDIEDIEDNVLRLVKD